MDGTIPVWERWSKNTAGDVMCETYTYRLEGGKAVKFVLNDQVTPYKEPPVVYLDLTGFGN